MRTELYEISRSIDASTPACNPQETGTGADKNICVCSIIERLMYYVNMILERQMDLCMYLFTSMYVAVCMYVCMPMDACTYGCMYVCTVCIYL